MPCQGTINYLVIITEISDSCHILLDFPSIYIELRLMITLHDACLCIVIVGNVTVSH